MDMGLMGKVQSVTYDDDLVVFNYSIKEDFIQIESLKKDPSTMKMNAKTLFGNPDSNMKRFFKLIVESEASIQLVFQGESSGETVECTLSTKEIQEAMNNHSISPQDKLDVAIESANAMMPQSLGNGLTITQMVMIGDDVTYCYSVDESVLSIDVLNQNSSSMKINVRSFLMSKDPTITNLAKMIIEANKNLVYKYTGDNSEKSFEIVFTKEELQEIFKPI